MQNHRFGLLFVLTVSAALIACQGKQAPQPAQSDASKADDTAAAAVQKAAPTPISLEPASMTGCDPIEALVKWDARLVQPDIAEIEVWVGKTDSKLWMANAPYGELKTGQWTGPGAVFILKNKADGKELARTEMQGPACG